MNFVTRFLGWSATSASLVAMGGTCPCCGAGIGACPQSLALFGIVGGLVGCALKVVCRPAADETKSEPNSWAPHQSALDLIEHNCSKFAAPRRSSSS